MFKKNSQRYIRMVCLLLVFAISLMQIPTTLLMAEPDVVEPVTPAYEMIDVAGGKQLDFHGTTTKIPLTDFVQMIGIVDVRDAMIKISNGDEVVFETKKFVSDYFNNLDWKGLLQLITSGDIDGALTSITEGVEIDIFEFGKTYKVEIGTIDISLQPLDISVKYNTTYDLSVQVFDVLAVQSNKPGVVIVGDTTVTDNFSTKVYRGEMPTVTVGMGDLINHTVSATLNGETILNEPSTYTFTDGMTEDCIIKVVYVEDVESTIVTGIVGSNATLNAPLTAMPETEVEFTVTPDAGYYITSIFVDDTSSNTEMPLSVEYTNGVAVCKFTTGATKTEYSISYSTAPVVVLKDNFISYDETATDLEIWDKIVELIDMSKSGEVFMADYDFDILYNASNANAIGENWQHINFEPSDLEKLTSHAFGHNRNAETVKIVYGADGKQYAPGEHVFTLYLNDMRKVIEIKVLDNVTVTYGEFDNAMIVNKVLGEGCGVLDAETQELIADAKLTIKNDLTKYMAGTHEVKVVFEGNETYRPAETTITVTINKAKVDLVVNSTAIPAGTDCDLNDIVKIDHSTVGYITMVIELDAMDQVSRARVDFSNVIRSNETIAELMKKILDTQVSKTFTWSELASLFEKLEEVGVEIDPQYLEYASRAVASLEQVDGIGTLEFVISNDASMTTKNVGLSIILAVTADANCDFTADIGYVAIVPDAKVASIAFNTEINGLVSLDEAENHLLDMGAHIVEEDYQAAAELLNHVFLGITVDGEIYASNDPSEVMGAYTQLVYLIDDFGNEIYYAAPIARIYLVAPNNANVVFLDDEIVYNEVFEREYDGKEKAYYAAATDANGDILPFENMTYMYVGIDSMARAYKSDVAPVNAGLYTVMAIYKDFDTMTVGVAIKPLIIHAAASGFELVDTTVEYDETAHFVEVKNPNGLEEMFIIVNGTNVNVIAPQITEEDLAEYKQEAQKLFNDIKELIAAERADEESKIPTEVLDKIENALNEVEGYTITFNGPKPVTIGEYTVYGVAYKENYALGIDEAVLKITEKAPVEEPKDPTNPDPTDPTEPADPTEPSDPQDPVDPSNPTDPSQPDEPKDDGSIETPKLGLETTSETALWGIIGLMSLLAFAFECVMLFKSKKKS